MHDQNKEVDLDVGEERVDMEVGKRLVGGVVEGLHKDSEVEDGKAAHTLKDLRSVEEIVDALDI